MLAYQFGAGLTPVLRTKVAGIEGSFEHLLVKARFKEAKIRDLVSSPSGGTQLTPVDANNHRRSNLGPGGGNGRQQLTNPAGASWC